MGLRKNLEGLLNRYSLENGSDTPDFILAEYLIQCLTAWNVAVKDRERWHGHRVAETGTPIPLTPIPLVEEGD